MSVPLPSKPASGSTINTGHSMASGLVRCVLFNEGSGSPVELVGAGTGTLGGSAAWATDTDLGGTCIDTGTTINDRVSFGANGLSAGNGDVTIFAGFRCPTIAARGHIVFELAGGTTDGMFGGVGDSGQLHFVLADVVVLDSAAMTYVAGSIYTCGWGYDRGVSIRYHVYNHTTDTTTTDTISNASSPTTSANPSVIGNRRDFGAGFDDRIAFVYIWNRVLSDSDFASMHSDPYQFISTGGRSDRRVRSRGWMVRRPV
jgi:hypothetical protein